MIISETSQQQNLKSNTYQTGSTKAIQAVPTRTVRIIPASDTFHINQTPFSGNDESGKSTSHPTRVAAYCRVSTEEDSQLNSYNSQIEYYTQYISSHPDWICAGIFADEGLSGTQTKNRKQFNRLLRKCRRHEINIILCKSISRFARNTVDCLELIRELKSLGIAVIFEKENLNTFSIPSEFLISLYASFAQAESESISRNITWGIEKKFRRGEFPYHLKWMTGYYLKADGTVGIDETEAALVREIYTLFASGMSMGKIATLLTSRNIPRRCGSTVWGRRNVEKILQNEKYAGFAILQKTYTIDCLTHERALNLGQRPKYYVENCFPPIINRELFDATQREFERRRNAHYQEVYEKQSANLSTKVSSLNSLSNKKFHPHYALSDLLICAHCGNHYRRVIWKSKGKSYAVWRCGNRLEHGPKYCSKSVSLHEEKLLNNLQLLASTISSNLPDTESFLEERVTQICICSKSDITIYFTNDTKKKQFSCE